MNWKKEITRDTVALGSIPFYFVILVRAVIGKYAPFVYQLLIALIILFISAKIIGSNQHIARGLIIVVFSSLFYKDILFTVFASVLLAMVILSLLYLKVEGKEVAKGALLGAISVTISFYLTPLLLAFFSKA